MVTSSTFTLYPVYYSMQGVPPLEQILTTPTQRSLILWEMAKNSVK